MEEFMNMSRAKVERPDRAAAGAPRLLPALAVAAGLLLGAGCEKDQVSRTEVTPAAPPAPASAPAPMPAPMPAHGAMPNGGMPPMPGGAMPGMPQGALPPPAQPAGKAALKWSLPKGWAEAPASGMRYATLTPPGGGKAEVSVVVLPGAAGGELANVNRWRGQIGLPPLDEPGLAAARKVVKAKAGAVAVYDFTSDGEVKSRMITGLLSTADGNTWFFKLMGDSDPVGKAKPGFMRYLETLHLD
jgi:hypothetical protein